MQRRVDAAHHVGSDGRLRIQRGAGSQQAAGFQIIEPRGKRRCANVDGKPESACHWRSAADTDTAVSFNLQPVFRVGQRHHRIAENDGLTGKA